jgi:excisionase family DNA binding protein
MNESISVDEACEFLECEKPKLMALLREGELPGVKFGKAWVIPREAFFAVVNATALQEAKQRREELAGAREHGRVMEAAAAERQASRPGRPRRPRTI